VTADDLDGSGATDCSIASQIKELAGTPSATVQHVPDLAPPAPPTQESEAGKPATAAEPAEPAEPAPSPDDAP
jgi:hypothetical protein